MLTNRVYIANFGGVGSVTVIAGDTLSRNRRFDYRQLAKFGVAAVFHFNNANTTSRLASTVITCRDPTLVEYRNGRQI